MLPITIRRATKQDLPALLRIERKSFGEEAWDREIFLHYLEDYRELFLIASVGGRAAGYAITALGERFAEIDSIAVKPRFRRHGVGRLLLRRTLRALARGKTALCFLMVRKSNKGAIAFYREFGFRQSGTARRYYPDGEDAWRMRLDLAAARRGGRQTLH